MSQRKKRPSQQHLDKIQKAQHRNEFIGKLKYLCDNLSGDKKLFTLIPSVELEKMYDLRSHAIRIIPEQEGDVEDDLLKAIKKLLPGILKITKVPVTEKGDLQISLSDFYTVAQTLFGYLEVIKDDSYPAASKVRQSLDSFYKFYSLNLPAWQALNNAAFFFILGFCEFSHKIYWHEVRATCDLYKGAPMGFCFRILTHVPEKIHVNLDGNSRPAFAVGWGVYPNKFEHVHIKAADLGIESSFSTIPMPVYIQSHAQQRLAERLDCLEQGYVEFFVYNSLKNLKYFKDKNGNPLIEYNYFGFKTGYLRADIHHGKIIIRTFLFLTNNGTPEGEKLNEFTGLSKLDHKYLNIDKLSTFMSADIRNNIEVKDIFVRAGCKSLFDIDANFIFDTKHGTNPVAAMNLSKYIKMPETESSLNAMSGLPINPQL